jgi:DNA-cytosine methyltransferase
MSHMQNSFLNPPSHTDRNLTVLNAILGLSQEEIAKRVGVSFTSVNAWCSRRSKPRKKSDERIDALLKTELAKLKDGDIRGIAAQLHIHYGAPRPQVKRSSLDELYFQLLGLKAAHRSALEAFDHFHNNFHPWKCLLHTEPEDLESSMKRAGFGTFKARSFIDIAKRLKYDFGSVSLEPIESMSTADAELYLTSLPGVGQKTARCVLLYSLDRNILPVDANTYRTAVRIGVIPTSVSTSDVHAAIDAVIPQSFSKILHFNLAALGQDACIDPTPTCSKCHIRFQCNFAAQHRNAVSNQNGASIDAVSYVKPARKSGKYVAVDLYAGCGGLSLGLEAAGFHVAYAMDWWNHACETHRNGMADCFVECRDVRQVTGAHIENVVGGPIDLVVGGPNCQGVSERGLRNPDDPRNFMFPEFVRIVSELRPRVFLMENVPGLAHLHNYDLLSRIFSSFEALGYKCGADVLLAANYGVPQLRYRFFLIGTLDKTNLSFPAPTHFEDGETQLFGRPFVTVRDALSDLPEIAADRQVDSVLPYVLPEPYNEFQKYIRAKSEGVLNHIVSATEEINLKRASHIPEGGNWKDIPADLLPSRFFACRMTDHSTTYARLRLDNPAYTITALFGNITAGAFTHPTQNRPLSIREGARIQSFPDWFRFYGPRNSQYRQIGNAVPPLLAKSVGEHLLRIMRGEKPASLSPRITRDVLDDKRAWDALPILTPRFMGTFGRGTRWPKGWGPEPKDHKSKLDDNYSLRPEFWPENIRHNYKKSLRKSH